jgi:hypothetical protein
MREFQAARRLPVRQHDDQTALFYREYKTLSFYWIMRAGHMVRIDWALHPVYKS